MQIVIDIPECFYEYCKTKTDAIEIELAVAKGIPLPKIGHWIEKEDYNLDTYYECSECGADYCIEGDILIHKYCPNCGAKMNGVETEVEDER